jgi:hypothetical protein
VVIANDERASGYWITASETRSPSMDSTHKVREARFLEIADEDIHRLPLLHEPAAAATAR